MANELAPGYSCRRAAMGAAGTTDVLADVTNYTSIAPVLQTSEGGVTASV